MEHYTISRVKVQVRHEDGTEEWLGAELHDGCRTVLVGLDACSTAGMYYRGGAGLAHLEESRPPAHVPPVTGDFRDAPEVDVDFDEEPDGFHAVPDLLEYRQGKWYRC